MRQPPMVCFQAQNMKLLSHSSCCLFRSEIYIMIDDEKLIHLEYERVRLRPEIFKQIKWLIQQP